MSSDNNESFRSGFVAFVGRPNAGKSTLTNALMGHKVAITSRTAQTTRHRLSAIIQRKHMQIILVDTPGIHKPHDALGEELNTTALKGLEDVDIAVMLVDATQPIGTGDMWVARQVHEARVRRSLLLLTKIDKVSQDMLAQQLERAHELGKFDHILPISAKSKENLDVFEQLIADNLEEGPRWFPEDMTTDQPLDVMVAEFIREKILRNFSDEVPHSIGVALEEMSYSAKKDLYRIFATIYVERSSQKGIIIGSGGAAIKKMGIQARHDLEQLLASRVFLDLNVKVKKNWRKDLNQIRRFGYGEGM
ncbi:MAG: GTPase Era [Eggerthellaceae bacterium]|nr:GTPase Era [Eggerthellaceae bacterium]